MTTPKSIVWLHLSDLHLCEPKTGWDAHRVLKSLIEDLKHMEQTHGLLPQLLFFTGDGAFGNFGSGKDSSLVEQYGAVETFLTGVRKAFSQEILKDHTFLVPGNHDVNRNEVTDLETHWIESQTNPDNITKLIRDKPKQWRLFMDRLTTYREFLEQNGYIHLLEDPDRLIYNQLREINGLKLGIGGFNSAWNCSRDKEKGKLWLGADWQDGTIVGNLDKLKADLKIALIHHPSGWFVEQEDALIRRNMENHFDFHLHGHEHQGWVNAINNHHVRIAAAASYEKSDQENGYNFVRLNLETGDVEIWLRRYDGQGGGWIPRVIAGKTNNDGLWLLKELPHIKKLKPITSNAILMENSNYPSSAKQTSSKPTENPTEKPAVTQQRREEKLITKLERQFKFMETNPVVIDFAEKIQKDFPELQQDWQNLSKHLVSGNGDRHKQIAQFLTSIESIAIDKSHKEPIRKLLAYLLQTLVRKCNQDSDQGLSRISVELKMTVELIINSRTVAPYIPSQNRDTQEHSNGQRNPQFEIVGNYLPETGMWDAELICQAIAKDILIDLDGTDLNYLNPLQELADKLSAYVDDLGNAPIRGLYLKKDDGHNPLNIDAVAQRFYQTLGDLLWIYVYGGQESEDWLHTTEGRVKGLLERYNNLIKPESQSNQRKTTEDFTMGNSGIKLENIGANTIVNIVTGHQADTQTGHGNIKHSGIDTKQLLTLIEQLKEDAHNADDVSKQQYAVITSAVKDIETEMQKKDGASKSILAKASEMLGGFKDVASIAENIDKITQVLLPFIS